MKAVPAGRGAGGSPLPRRTLIALVLGSLVLALAPTPAAAPAGAGACLPACTILGGANAFVPSVAVVASGATVTWESFDILHTATASQSYCFHTQFILGVPDDASFRVEDGVVYAWTDTRGERACPDAVAVGDGVFALAYYCAYHPPMKGQLLIVAG